jgi:hypothetical protein
MLICGIKIDTIKYNSVKIKDDDDHSVWSLNVIETSVPIIGCKALAEEGREEQHVWWWRTIWKLRFHSKNKIFMWLILNNGAPTRELLQNTIFISLIWCSLCP